MHKLDNCNLVTKYLFLLIGSVALLLGWVVYKIQNIIELVLWKEVINRLLNMELLT